MQIVELPINIDEKAVIRYMGYKGKRQPPSKIKKEINLAILQAKKHIKARACYDYFNFTFVENKIIIAEDIYFTGEDIVRKLKKADYIAVAILTLGDKIDEITTDCFSQGDYIKGMAYNSIGCAVLDDLRKNFGCKLKGKLKQNITKSYSPGNDNWEISNQYAIFELLDASTIGVTLLKDSVVMKPTKSLSVIYGIGEKVQEDDEGHNCSVCNSKNCYYRVY